LLAALLPVATDERYPLPSLSPQIAIFEDAHWMDRTSRELLDLIIDRAHSAGAAADHLPAGIHAPVGEPRACHDDGAEPAR
jgi:hypothetical protein